MFIMVSSINSTLNQTAGKILAEREIKHESAYQGGK